MNETNSATAVPESPHYVQRRGMNTLLNYRVLIRISDQWEIGEALKWEALMAQIVAVGDNEVRLDEGLMGSDSMKGGQSSGDAA